MAKKGNKEERVYLYVLAGLILMKVLLVVAMILVLYVMLKKL